MGIFKLKNITIRTNANFKKAKTQLQIWVKDILLSEIRSWLYGVINQLGTEKKTRINKHDRSNRNCECETLNKCSPNNDNNNSIIILIIDIKK